MKNIIFDGRYYYLFRALNDGDKKNLEKGIDSIQTDANRYFHKYQTWGKYNDHSEMSLEEIYDHVKMKHRQDTNCISLTQDANVALTYHTENPQYVVIKISPEQLKDYLSAGDHFFDAVKQQVEETEKGLSDNDPTAVILKKIENAENITQIRKILKNENSSLQTDSINKRQYLTYDEQIRMSKVNAKLKVLEYHGLIGNIITGVPNIQILQTMGNAYTSSEYIHYGDISSESVIHCPKIFMDMFALLQQAETKGLYTEDIQRLNNKLLELLNEYHRKDRQMPSIAEITFLEQEYENKSKQMKDVSIERAYELTKGKISHHEVNMQAKAIYCLSEMLLRKKALIEFLKKVFPEEQDIEKILEDAYCINSELTIKQNRRGYKLSNTVNLFIEKNGYELSKENTKALLESVSALTVDQLLEVFNNDVSSDEIEKLFVKTRKKAERIQMPTRTPEYTKYMVEAIIEGYNWKECRTLTRKRKKYTCQKNCDNRDRRRKIT